MVKSLGSCYGKLTNFFSPPGGLGNRTLVSRATEAGNHVTIFVVTASDYMDNMSPIHQEV